MLRLAITTFALLFWTAGTALAQPVFSNPFATAAAYRAERGGVSDAHYRARYELTRTGPDGAAQTGELTIDAADDWALVRQDGTSMLYDYRLNRVFVMTEGGFVSTNGMAPLVFRIMERQNRAYLERVMAQAGVQAAQLPDGCDAETELGIVVPGIAASGVQVNEQRGAFTFRCGGRDMGSFTAGEGAAPPAAFWPTINIAMLTHPALFQRMRANGHAPAQLEVNYRSGGRRLRAARGA